MQKNTEQTYRELREQYTDEEIADSVLFNEELSAKEQRAVDEEFRKLRLEHLKSLTAKDRLIGDIIQMKVLIKKYFRQERYDEQYSFANQLKAYIKLTNRSNKEIAENLDIHPTKLSRIINGRDTPNIELMYRLEKHSDGELPAHYWWRLHSRALEFQIKTNLEQKVMEGEKVSNYLDIKG